MVTLSMGKLGTSFRARMRRKGQMLMLSVCDSYELTPRPSTAGIMVWQATRVTPPGAYIKFEYIHNNKRCDDGKCNLRRLILAHLP